MGGIIILFPLCCAAYLVLKREELEDQIIISKTGILFQDARYKSNAWSLLNYPLFLLRRLGFALIPFLLTLLTGCQLIVLVLSTEAYIIMFIAQITFNSKGLKRLVVFNDVLLVVMIYFQVMFSHYSAFTAERFLKFNFRLGYYYIGLIGTMVAVNLGYAAYHTAQYLLRLHRINRLIKTQAKELAKTKANNLLKRYKASIGVVKVKTRDVAIQTEDLPKHIVIEDIDFDKLMLDDEPRIMLKDDSSESEIEEFVEDYRVPVKSKTARRPRREPKVKKSART